MAGFSLRCGDCGALLKSVEEAQEHAEVTSHANFSESTEPVLNLVCSSCGKPCRSKTESDLHTKRTGHTDFVDKTAEAAKPISLEAPKTPDVDMVDAADASTGNSNLDAAANWIVEHENDSDIDQMPLVPVNTKSESSKPSLTPEEMKIKIQELKKPTKEKADQYNKEN